MRTAAWPGRHDLVPTDSSAPASAYGQGRTFPPENRSASCPGISFWAALARRGAPHLSGARGGPAGGHGRGGAVSPVPIGGRGGTLRTYLHGRLGDRGLVARLACALPRRAYHAPPLAVRSLALEPRRDLGRRLHVQPGGSTGVAAGWAPHAPLHVQCSAGLPPGPLHLPRRGDLLLGRLGLTAAVGPCSLTTARRRTKSARRHETGAGRDACAGSRGRHSAPPREYIVLCVNRLCTCCT